MNKAIILASMAVIFPLTIEAGGLELYSYEDNQGQLIIVDSLERIPMQFRSRAKRNYIPSFKDSASTNKTNSIPSQTSSKGSATKEKAIPSENQDNEVIISEPQETDSNGKIDIVEPLEEEIPPDTGIAEGTNVIEGMDKIIANNRQIYNLVLGTKEFSPAVKNLHTQNIAFLAKTKDPKYIFWERSHSVKNQWSSQASNLFERFKTIQYTVSEWFGQQPGNLLHMLPAYIEASDGHLRELKAAFEKVKQTDEEQRQQLKKTKKKK